MSTPSCCFDHIPTCIPHLIEQDRPLFYSAASIEQHHAKQHKGTPTHPPNPDTLSPATRSPNFQACIKILTKTTNPQNNIAVPIAKARLSVRPKGMKPCTIPAAMTTHKDPKRNGPQDEKSYCHEIGLVGHFDNDQIRLSKVTSGERIVRRIQSRLTMRPRSLSWS